MKTKTDFNKAEWHLYHYLKSKGFKLRVGQIKDFRLIGDEPENEIEGYAEDFISEVDDDTDVDYTPQDRYHDENSWSIRQGEMIDQFRNEY